MPVPLLLEVIALALLIAEAARSKSLGWAGIAVLVGVHLLA